MQQTEARPKFPSSSELEKEEDIVIRVSTSIISKKRKFEVKKMEKEVYDRKKGKSLMKR